MMMDINSPKYNYAQLVNLSPPKRYSKKVFVKSLKQKQFHIHNRENFNKPQGGLWSSTYHSSGLFNSDWIQWCAEICQADWIGHDNILLEIKKTARIFTIHSFQDLKNLYSLYPVDIYGSTYQRDYTICYLDFENIRKDYDIIWMTDEGQHMTRYTEHFGDNKRLDLYGWDCESSLILNNVVNRFKKVTTRKRS